ncbi:TcaA 3rd/4th domain-containing protein, partial [Bacillus paralicheniformis]|uniref:TcaA 3rd/4th domain-containing protein n=2 Tax=Bacillus paralicheniformis TaxID=1648923 RepID=UPI0037C16B80
CIAQLKKLGFCVYIIKGFFGGKKSELPFFDDRIVCISINKEDFMKKKFLFIGVPIVAILAIILFISGRSPEPSDLAKEFEEKVKQEDAKGLLKLVKVDNGTKWGEKEAESIIKYLKDDESDYKDQIMLLNAQASYYESDGKANNIISQQYPGESISNIGPFYITKEKGIFGGEKYVLKARGYKLEVHAAKGANVTFNGETIDMQGKDSKELGVFGPGVYTIKGSKKYDYTTVDDKTEVTLFDPEKFEKTASLNFSGDTVSVNSDIPNTKVLVDGKESGESISENTEFGPVKDGIKLQGVAEFPWGEGKSEAVTVQSDTTEEYNLTPNPIVNDDMREKLKSQINDFAKDRNEAKVKKDANKLKNVSDNLKKSYIDVIKNYDKENYYEGKALGTRIDFSKVTYENGSGGKQLIHIPVEFHLKSREVYEFMDSELEENFDEEIVTLQYDEEKKSWIIEGEKDDYESSNNDYMASKDVAKTTF